MGGVLEGFALIKIVSAQKTGRGPGGGGGGCNTARHCHGHKQCAGLYLHASIDISNCTCIC